MPRAVKAPANPIKKAAAGAKRKKNEYNRPEKIPKGEILIDLLKQQWKIGPSIGAGGFGEIYSACKASSSPKTPDGYDHVIKIEPHENGPLFVEMHFYMRNARLDDIINFCKKKGIKSLGMPHLVGNGSHEVNGIKHRFIVMPRYGKDVWSLYLANNRKLPEHTVYRIALQMIDVFEYVHGCSYVHADLKGANILLGYGKSGSSQAYLVDFGLASHYTTKDFKPDPKKMHNGTIEYTSRDAHNGIPTMRGDLEILGYNLVNWLGSRLPWETENILSVPVKVQKEKEEFMKNTDKSLGKLFQNVPVFLREFFKYISTLKYNDTPDYDKCRKFFQNGLKSLGKSNNGELDFKLNKSQIKSSTDDFDEKPQVKTTRRAMKSSSPMKRQKPNDRNGSPIKKLKMESKTSTPKENIKTEKSSPSNYDSSSVVSTRRNTARTSTPQGCGSTIVNDNITPNPKSKKTYEFNFELNVSVDADVVVNVKRKKKTKNDNESNTENGSTNGTPIVKIRKVNSSKIKTEKKSPQRRNLRK